MTADGTSLALSSIITPNIPCSLVRPSLLPPLNELHVFTGFYFVFITDSFSPPSSKRLKNFPRQFCLSYFVSQSDSLVQYFFSLLQHTEAQKKSELWSKNFGLGPNQSSLMYYLCD